MSVLVKGMKMPKACCECGFNHCSQSRDDDTCLLLDKGISQLFVLVDRLPDCPLVEVPTPHGRLIDADALYEKTAEWEAQALHMVEKTMNDEDKSEWRKWSVVLTERSAFKYDVADMPTIIEAEEGEPDD